jgi:hypothetical protein
MLQNIQNWKTACKYAVKSMKTYACVTIDTSVTVAVMCQYRQKLLYRKDLIFNDNKSKHALKCQTYIIKCQ